MEVGGRRDVLEHQEAVVLLVLLLLEEHEVDEEEGSQEDSFHSNVLQAKVMFSQSG